MNHGNEFDDILAAALREYREAEPLAGIEDRVLRRLQSHAAWYPNVGWRWRMAAALAVLVALLCIGLRHGYQRQWSPSQLVLKTPAVPVSPQTGEIRTHETPGVLAPSAPSHARQPATLATARRLPVRPQFPIPEPLDREERALLALAQSDPEALRSFMQGENSTADIAPITIEPLEHSSGTEGED